MENVIKANFEEPTEKLERKMKSIVKGSLWFIIQLMILV